jgi:hypothetical protein
VKQIDKVKVSFSNSNPPPFQLFLLHLIASPKKRGTETIMMFALEEKELGRIPPRETIDPSR